MARSKSSFTPIRNLSENDWSAINGAVVKLHSIVKDLVPGVEALPSPFNPHDLSQVRETLTRAFAAYETTAENSRRDRRAKLRDIVFSHAAFDAAMTAAVAHRDILDKLDDATKRAANIVVPVNAEIDYMIVKLAALAKHPGTTDEDLVNDLKALRLETASAGKGKQKVLVPFAMYAEWAAARKEAAAETPKANGKSNGKAAPMTATAGDAE